MIFLCHSLGLRNTEQLLSTLQSEDFRLSHWPISAQTGYHYQWLSCQGCKSHKITAAMTFLFRQRDTDEVSLDIHSPPLKLLPLHWTQLNIRELCLIGYTSKHTLRHVSLDILLQQCDCMNF